MRKSEIAILAGFLISLTMTGCGDMNRFFSMNRGSHYDKGTQLLQDGELDAALKELTKAKQANPKFADTYTAIGDVYRKKGDYTKASNSYKTACKKDPYSFRPHYNLGVTYQGMAELSRTLEKAQKFLRRAVQIYIRAVALKPDSFDANLNLGACYFQLGKTSLAERQTIKALKINSDSAIASNNLAIMYEAQGKLEEAILAYKASLEAASDQPEVLMNLGSIYFRLGRLKSALATYRSASRVAPKLASPHEQMGVCLFRLKKLDAAFDEFQTAIRINPHSPGAYRGYGVICMYKYVSDRSLTDLKNKSLWAWDFSLQLQPGQDDLIRLIERFGPVPPLPAEQTQSAEATALPAPIAPAVPVKANKTDDKNDKNSPETWQANPKTAELKPHTN